jgi:hypothetical protein
VSFRYDPALAAPSLATSTTRLSPCRGLSRARPPSLPTGAERFLARYRQALLWVRLAPNDFCNSTSDARTRPRAPDSRLPSRLPSHVCQCTRDLAFALATPLGTRRPSPVEEGPRTLRAVTTPPMPNPASLQERRRVKASEADVRSRRRLRAAPRSDHRLRRWPLNSGAGLHGPGSPERRTTSRAA